MNTSEGSGTRLESVPDVVHAWVSVQRPLLRTCWGSSIRAWLSPGTCWVDRPPQWEPCGCWVLARCLTACLVRDRALKASQPLARHSRRSSTSTPLCTCAPLRPWCGWRCSARVVLVGRRRGVHRHLLGRQRRHRRARTWSHATKVHLGEVGQDEHASRAVRALHRRAQRHPPQARGDHSRSGLRR